MNRNDDGLWLNTNDGRPDNEWNPGNRFVFLRPRKSHHTFLAKPPIAASLFAAETLEWADMSEMPEKSEVAKREEKILEFWEREHIFEKSLAKKSPKGEFVFYEGPPTANGKPGIHHLESRAFKDAIPRYKTMRGYRVNRRAGWDTHGLQLNYKLKKSLASAASPI